MCRAGSPGAALEPTPRKGAPCTGALGEGSLSRPSRCSRWGAPLHSPLPSRALSPRPSRPSGDSHPVHSGHTPHTPPTARSGGSAAPGSLPAPMGLGSVVSEGASRLVSCPAEGLWLLSSGTCWLCDPGQTPPLPCACFLTGFRSDDSRLGGLLSGLEGPPANHRHPAGAVSASAVPPVRAPSAKPSHRDLSTVLTCPGAPLPETPVTPTHTPASEGRCARPGCAAARLRARLSQGCRRGASRPATRSARGAVRGRTRFSAQAAGGTPPGSALVHEAYAIPGLSPARAPS